MDESKESCETKQQVPESLYFRAVSIICQAMDHNESVLKEIQKMENKIFLNDSALQKQLRYLEQEFLNQEEEVSEGEVKKQKVVPISSKIHIEV